MLALLTASLVVACHASTATSPVDVSGLPVATFSIAVNQELDITMQTIGPGSYVAPPALSGSTIAFLEVTAGTLNVPAGATQIFHFKGVAPGQTIIRFHNTDSMRPDAIDTVVVR